MVEVSCDAHGNLLCAVPTCDISRRAQDSCDGCRNILE